MNENVIPMRIEGGEIQVKATLGQTVIKVVAPDEYVGDTTVTPSDETQVLSTKDKLVKDNITVNPAPAPDLRPLSVSENGSYQPEGFDGYSQVSVDVVPKELYPIGSDVVSVCLGRNWQNGRALLSHGTYTNTGDFTETGDESNQSFCPVYIPISPEYTYNKNNYRITAGFWYDENKNFISSFSQNNTSWVSLPTPPDNAKYLRFASNTGWSNAAIAIYRTA